MRTPAIRRVTRARQSADPVTILAFEGPDKVGKSTIIRAINKRTNYKYLCIDRFVGSAWVYDRLFARRNRERSLTALEDELSDLRTARVVNVLLRCEANVLKGRIERLDENPSGRLAGLRRASLLYREYATRVSSLPVIEVDTTRQSVSKTVSEILAKVRRL